MALWHLMLLLSNAAGPCLVCCTDILEHEHRYLLCIHHFVDDIVEEVAVVGVAHLAVFSCGDGSGKVVLMYCEIVL